MTLSFALDAPPAVRWFTRLFFFRAPLPEEVGEISSTVAWLQRRWAWSLAAYLAFAGLLILPGVLRDKGFAYTLVAILLPHLGLYLILMSVAYSWVGFRVNLGNLREYMAMVRRTQRKQSLMLIAGWGLAGALTGYLTAASTVGRVTVGDEIAAWLADTFTPGVVMLLLLLAIVGVPELVARLRLRQHRLAQQLAEALAAQEKLARQTAESELRLLQAQVEPHFLYNTLANLRYLVQSKSPDALAMTDALIEYLRTSVPDMRAQQVTLGREADHARHYLEIMRMRMGGRLTYAVDVPPLLRDVPLPPLVLLTLVENAVKHGIAPHVNGGHIAVAARAEDDALLIEVVDNGVGVDRDGTAAARSEAPSSGAGLRNIAGRLALAYGQAAAVEIGPAEPRGTRAALRLPRTAPAAPHAGRVELVLMTDDEATAAGMGAVRP